MRYYTTARYILIVLVFFLSTGSLSAQSFITTWKTDNPGTSNDDQITIPTTGTGYDYNVDWGDGMSNASVTGNITHTYATPGTYTVSITGMFPRIYFNAAYIFDPPKDNKKLLTIEQWGNIAWTSMGSAFAGCENLRINAPDKPDLSGVTDMSKMFHNAKALNDNINHWNVSNVTNMNRLFMDAEAFNQPLNSWDVSNVTKMNDMFSFATSFNQDIRFVAGGANTGGDAWNTANVLDMGSMFGGATVFNQDIGNWNVNNVKDMRSMFSVAVAFNQNIGNWNISNVTDIRSMFNGATAFDQDISTKLGGGNNGGDAWNTSSLTDLSFFFTNAIAFNQDINNWDVSNVTNMSSLFQNATAFNQDIGTWKVSNATDMSDMFNGAISFNQDIGNWQFSTVSFINLKSMFTQASSFNQDISFKAGLGNNGGDGWNTSMVSNMNGMLALVPLFNQDISGWNVGNVTDMRAMLGGAAAFDQDLSSWDVSKLLAAASMLDNSGLSVSNYDNLLEGWAAQTLKPNVNFGASNLLYCVGGTARAAIIANFNWSITDAGTGCINVFAGTDTTAPEILNGQVSAYDFGSIDILPSTKPKSFTIQNNRDITINVAMGITGTAFATPGGPFAIAPGNTHTFVVTLSSATANTFSETLSISSTEFPAPFQFPITGVVTATPEPEIVIFDALYGDEIITGSYTLDFDYEFRGNDITRSITIYNIGSADLNLTNISISGTVFSLASAPPASIAADNSITLDLILDGTVAGSFYETITITNDDTDESVFDFGLAGEIYGPEISVFDGLDRYSDPELSNGQSTAIDFGAVAQGTDIPRTLTIANFGQVDMTISDISISGTAFSTTFSPPQFIVGEVDGIISTITFDLALSGATGGTFNETVTISSDDDTDPLFVFPLTGIITSTVCALAPTVSAGTDANLCAGSSILLAGSIGGSATTAAWSTSGTGSFDDANLLSATYTPTAADETAGAVTLTLTVAANGSCPQVQDQMLVTIPAAPIAGSPTLQSNVNQVANVDIIGASTISAGNTITVTILQNPTKGTVVIKGDNSIDYTSTLGTIGPDSFEYQICNQCGLCSPGTVAISILNASPVITPPTTTLTTVAGQSITIPFRSFLSDLNDNIDFNSISIMSGPLSQASASFDNDYNLILDYSNTAFAGTDQITIQVCDLLTACSQITLQIEVEGEIIVHNGISPNGDDKNEFFHIKNIEFLEPENSVHIYNRWGDKVFEIENYDNEARRFEGRQTNGNFLPSGVYFYKVEFVSGRDPMSGYLTLKL